MNEENSKIDAIDHLKVIKHNAFALSSRLNSFLEAEKQHIQTLNKRLTIYAQNLIGEVDRLQNRKDYSIDRHRGLLTLIDDCDTNWMSLKTLEKEYTEACSESISNISSIKRPAIESADVVEAKKQRTVDENQNETTQNPDAACFVCPFCMLKIHNKSQNAISSYDIVTHLKCHNGKSFQCIKCNAFGTTRTNILNHILCKHPEDKIKYYHNRATELQKVTIQLKCNICEIVTKTSTTAVEHYTNNHPGLLMDLTAIPSIQQTTFEMKINRVAGEYTWTVRQQWLCDNCEHSDTTISKLLNHHNTEHPNEVIVMKLGKELVATTGYEHLNRLVYGCVHCQVAQQPIIHFEEVENVHAHWMAQHAPEFKPFQFYAVQFVGCYHCDVISTFDGLKGHRKEMHTNKPFIVVDVNDRQKCGICRYANEDMAEHFANEHKSIMQNDGFNPIRLTNEQLSKLLAINIHKKIQCGHCNDAFDSNPELREHWLKNHLMEKSQIHSYFIDQRIQIKPSCCEGQFERNDFVLHFSKHNFSFRCTTCNVKTGNLMEILEHDSQFHIEKFKTKDRLITLSKSLMKIYSEAKVVFGNGLAVKGYNLLRTDYDESNRINEFIKVYEKHEESVEYGAKDPSID